MGSLCTLLQISSPIELEFVFEGEYFDYLTANEPEYLAALALIGGTSPGHSVPAPEVPTPTDALGSPVVVTATTDGTSGGIGAINLLTRGARATQCQSHYDLKRLEHVSAIIRLSQHTMHAYPLGIEHAINNAWYLCKASCCAAVYLCLHLWLSVNTSASAYTDLPTTRFAPVHPIAGNCPIIVQNLSSTL